MEIAYTYSSKHYNTGCVYNHLSTSYRRNNLKRGLTSDVFVKNTNVSFHGSEEFSYEKFMARYYETYGNQPINEVIRDIIQNSKELNHGKEKRVFIFPKMEDYLIAHLYNQPHLDKDLPLEKCDIKYPQYNFGQPIAKNGYDILITKYIPGVPNSVNGTHPITDYICKNNSATREMAKEYLSKLRLFKDFPQESYDHFAQQIKYLQDNGAFVDIDNCNNLLVDAENQKFHIIDLPSDAHNRKAKIISEQLGGAKQSAHGMICLLLDPRFQPYYLEKMTLEEQKETKIISKNVIEKTFIAAKKASLSTKQNFVEVVFQIKQLRKNLGANFSRRYPEFLKLYRL